MANQGKGELSSKQSKRTKFFKRIRNVAHWKPLLDVARLPLLGLVVLGALYRHQCLRKVEGGSSQAASI